MALLERLAILITADAAGAISEMKKLADEAEKNLGKAGSTSSTLSGQMTKVGAAMVGVGAGMLAAGVAAANTTESLGKEVIKLQRFTGLSAEEASKLGYAARMSGIDIDTMSTNLGRLAKSMDTAPQKFTSFGVEVRTADGHMRNMSDVLLDVADKFKAMGPGTETTAKALELFGRNGASMLPFLLKGRSGITELTKEAEKMGLVLSQDNVNAVKNHIVAQRELNAAIDGVKNQIGQQMLPILTDFSKLIGGLPGPIKDVIGPITVIGGAIAIMGGAALIAAGQVQRLQVAYTGLSSTGQTVVKALGVIGGALAIGLAAWLSYESAVKSAKQTARSASDELIATNLKSGLEDLKRSLQNFETEAKTVKTRLDNFHIVLPWDRARAEGQRQAANESAKQIRELISQSEALAGATGRSTAETLSWLSSQRESGTTYESTATALAAYTGKIDTNKLSTEEATSAQDGFAASIRSANDAVRAATDPYFAVIDAQQNLTDAKRDYDELVGGGKATQDELDAAYEKQVRSAFALQGTLASLAEEALKGKTGSEKFKGALELLRQFGIDPSTEQGQRLIEKIAGISWQAALTAGYLNDNPLRIRADDSSAQAVIRRLEALRNAINPLTGTVGLEDVFNVQFQALGGRVGQGYASGGRPQPYIVGELGPELFVPDTAGTIVTADRTRQMLSGGGPTVVQNFAVEINTVAGDPAAIERVVVDAIGRANKRGMTALVP